MADLSYTVDVNTGPAQRNLDQLNKRVDKLNSTFAGFKSALAGLAIGAAVSNVIRLADSIQDVSDATGIAVQNVLGFQKAVELNGGTAEQAQQSIYKFVQSLGAAAEGSREVQEAFKEVGVSITDLRNLSEQDLLAKTVKGLANIDDASKRAVLTTQLLGKSSRGLNFKGVASDLDAATASSVRFAKSVQQTAEMQGKLDKATQRVQESLLKAIQPLVEFINKMDDEKLGNMIETAVDLTAKLAALTVAIYALEKSFTAIQKIIVLAAGAFVSFKLGAAAAAGGLALLLTNLKTVGNILKNIGMLIAIPFTTFSGILGRIVTIIVALIGSAVKLATAFGAIGLGLVRMIPFIGLVVTGFLALNEAAKLFTGNSLVGWFDAGIDKIKEYLGFQKKVSDVWSKGPDESAAETNRLKNQNEMLKPPADREVTDKEGESQLKILQEHQKKLKDIQLEYRTLGSEAENYSNQLRNDLQYQTSKLKMSEDEIEMADALRNETQRYLDLRDDLSKRFSATNSELDAETQKRKTLTKDEALASDLRISALQEELAQIKTLGDQYYQNHLRNGKAIEQELSVAQKIRFEENQRVADMERMTQAIEAQIARQQQLSDLLVSANDKMKDVQFAGAQQQRSPLEQQLAAIQEEARKAALEAGRVFAASYDGMDLTSAQSEELAAGLQQIAEKYKLIATEQTNNLTASRTWEQGWKTAFDNYMDNATNAAQQAGQAFSSITRNMESAIDNFVQTGKFSFKDFTRSIIQDLIKIELKAQATKLLGALGGGGGIFSAIGSLFGFANGGTPPLNKPSIVGEQGPELFVPKSAGTIIPNDRLGGGGAGMISAPVTNNYITNNISAVDAKSVAQLFAENRKTLLGTVEMARKELPYSNR